MLVHSCFSQCVLCHMKVWSSTCAVWLFDAWVTSGGQQRATRLLLTSARSMRTCQTGLWLRLTSVTNYM